MFIRFFPSVFLFHVTSFINLSGEERYAHDKGLTPNNTSTSRFYVEKNKNPLVLSRADDARIDTTPS